MKRSSVVFIVSAVLLLLNIKTVQAQDKWSLERCIGYAKENNLSMIQGEMSIELQQIDLNQQRMNRYPTLNGNATHAYNLGRSIDPFTNQFENQSIQSNSFGLSSGVNLFSGFRIKHNINQSQSLLKERKLDKMVLENNISLQIADLYLQTLFNMEQLRIAELQKETTEAQLERSRNLFKAGKTDKSDVLNQESQLSMDVYNITVAKNNINLSQLALKQLLQLDPFTPFEIEVPEISGDDFISSYMLDQVIDSAIKTFPEIRKAEQALVSAEIGTKVAGADRYPSLRLFANVNTLYTQSNKEAYDATVTSVPIGYVDGTNEDVLSQITTYKTRTTAFNQQLSDNFGQSFGISLSVPIFNNYQVNNRISTTKINYDIRSVELAQAKNQLINDVTSAYTTYVAAIDQFRAAQTNYTSQSESYELNARRYEAGLITSAEILLFRNNLNAAASNLNTAKYQLVFSKTQLDFYLGRALNI